jgi:hypothetical protein
MRELPPPTERPWFERLDREDRVHQAGIELRTRLSTVADCEAYLEVVCLEAGHFLRMSNDLRDWAQATGDEDALLIIEANTKAGCGAMDSTIGLIRRRRARLLEEVQRQERSDDREA